MATGALPLTPLGELKTLPDPYSAGEGDTLTTPYPHSAPSALGELASRISTSDCWQR